ncbi:MAG: Peroxisome biosynthesis protein pex1 [Thelocarpon superellum]|nr:MAG: Peroxisome biosynthesis protein pex1 [Thelocarpon superellum]
MAPWTKKAPATQAEVTLVHLKNCLVNLPSSLVAVLSNSNTPAQNVIVELSYAPPSHGTVDHAGPKSIYAGWTGMPSKRKLAPVVGREGINDRWSGAGRRDRDLMSVEIDATFGRMLGLTEGQQVGIQLHLDPPLAHTVNIEPVTADDWEIIELHATFLELNLLSQIRALPNPSSASSNGQHALTLHLSPTSTANIAVTGLTPALAASAPFARIGPDAEVIVAPKARARPAYGDGRDSSRSGASVSRKSIGGRSRDSTARHKSHRDDGRRPALFLRGVDRGIGGEWFEHEPAVEDSGLKVWVDADVRASNKLRGVQWVSVSVVQPAGLLEPVDPSQQAQPGQAEQGAEGDHVPAKRVVASLGTWEHAPNNRHVALSSSLCACLGSEGLVGNIVRIEAAPQPLQSHVTTVKVLPFVSMANNVGDGLKFGGESKAEREAAAREIRRLYGFGDDGNKGLLDGPLTDGLLLSKTGVATDSSWEGGVLRLHPSPPPEAPEAGKSRCAWTVISSRKLNIEVQPAVARPVGASRGLGPGEALPTRAPALVGIDALIHQLMSHLSHSSSVLLTGALGSGKTCVTQLVGHRLRNGSLFYTTYFPCRTLVTDETRVLSVKETLLRLFMTAAWCARLGGRALVMLDDLDKLCPGETELQVGGENGRSRQISEIVCTIVRQFCGRDTGVVVLATAQGKEALNRVIVGGHVVREFVGLKAPNKEGRRKLLEQAVGEPAPLRLQGTNGSVANGTVKTDPTRADAAWMDGSSADSPSGSPADPEGFVTDRDLDLLDLAGQTDGYMPGDLVLLASRARSEALIRGVGSVSSGAGHGSITLGKADFDRAIHGFTPASLRNVTLQRSTTTWASIGGLRETRQILLETLQYPTTYAPIFAQCPLRLRSGLLLYGYPGCGKTLLASAVAGECGLNFISVKGPEILNKYIGASEKSVRDLFERAESARPCVLFFDEFDSIAPKRGHDSTGVTDRVVNQLLTQMDGAEGLSGVYVLAATSRPDLIDPALLRPGRLDKSLLCDLPSLEDRSDILRALSKSLTMSEDVLAEGLPEVARRTEGYSGADLQALVYNAQLEAIHDVLGDHGEASTGRPAEQQKRAGQGTGASRPFLSFKYGVEEQRQEEEDRRRVGDNAATWLGQRAAITAKLDAIRQARRRQRQLRRGIVDGANDQNGSAAAAPADDQVVIRWKHILASLSSTRASISADERRRLVSVYREFVVGRNGEMPNGQGPTEVGGRSSLM